MLEAATDDVLNRGPMLSRDSIDPIVIRGAQLEMHRRSRSAGRIQWRAPAFHRAPKTNILNVGAFGFLTMRSAAIWTAEKPSILSAAFSFASRFSPSRP